MLWPPTYSYIKQLLYDQANPVAENQLDNANENVNYESVNYVLDRIDKYQQAAATPANRHHSSLVEQSINMNKLAASTDHQAGQLKARIPSSLSCSFLNGQIVYTVNTIKNNTTDTLNSIDGGDLNCGNSLDVKGSAEAECSPVLNANSRVQIIGSGSLHETENLPLHLDSLSRALMIEEPTQSKLAMLGASSNLMLSSCRQLIPRSFTSTALSSSYLKRFSIRILRRIKSMQNLKPESVNDAVQNL